MLKINFKKIIYFLKNTIKKNKCYEKHQAN